MPDEKTYIFKVPYLYGRCVCRCGGHKREGECALPGEIYRPAPVRVVEIPKPGGGRRMRGILEELDGWICRKLRCVLWRQWKRTFTRVKHLMRAGLDEVRAWKSATNGRGPWWNAGASHMNQAYPAKFFESLGLIRLTNHHLKLSMAS